MTTKDKIIEASVLLFNEQGVEGITTRHIAKHLGMSQGNLHYHYPNKNQIILTIFEGFLDQIKAAEHRSSTDIFVKDDVLASLIANFKIMYEFRFLFKDHELVWRRLPSIKTTIISLFDLKKAEIKEMIVQYQQMGIFRLGISEAQIDFLSEQFLFAVSSWLGATDYLKQDKDLPVHFAKFTFRFWLPYLTDEEMKSWEAIL